jgi:hypothetical protein
MRAMSNIQLIAIQPYISITVLLLPLEALLPGQQILKIPNGGKII